MSHPESFCFGLSASVAINHGTLGEGWARRGGSGGGGCGVCVCWVHRKGEAGGKNQHDRLDDICRM